MVTELILEAGFVQELQCLARMCSFAALGPRSQWTLLASQLSVTESGCSHCQCQHSRACQGSKDRVLPAKEIRDLAYKSWDPHRTSLEASLFSFYRRNYFYFQSLPTRSNACNFHTVISKAGKLSFFFSIENFRPFSFNFIATLSIL